MKEIKLTRGLFTQVDDKDFDYLNQFKWYVLKGHGGFYAIRKENCKKILMHRFILNTPDNMITDHKDGNTLNNQRNNIRICDKRQNAYNSNPQKGRKYKGCIWSRITQKWIAQIKVDGKQKYLDKDIEKLNKQIDEL